MRAHRVVVAATALALLGAACSADGEATPTRAKTASLNPVAKQTQVASVATQGQQAKILLYPATGGTARTLASGPGSFEGLTWSRDGSRLAFDSDTSGNFEVWTVNADGTGLHDVTNDPAADGSPTWSPDGTRLAFFSSRDGSFDLWTANADGTASVNLTNLQVPAAVSEPVWSPDGTRIAYVVGTGQQSQLWSIASDGSDPRALTTAPGSHYNPAWSPDSTRLVMAAQEAGDPAARLSVINADGTGQLRITQDAGPDEFPVFSPDGSAIVFLSGRNSSPRADVANKDVWVVDPSGRTSRQITNTAEVVERFPSWSSDGKLLTWTALLNREEDVVVANVNGSGAKIRNSPDVADEFPAFRPRPG